jgi:regulator of protease activity HflC (stomatin/prohibitin superfamily)
MTNGPEPYQSEADLPEMESESPRRAASAMLEVDARVGEQALLREAMDPANQSLADALKLSFRLLQWVIVVLIFMFLASGLKVVEQGQSGVMLRFGEIVQVKGAQALEPGRAWSLLPYPAGDAVTFEIENLSADLGGVFWPAIPSNRTIEQAVDSATTGRGLVPGRDGSVLTRDGDLAHLRVTASYEIADPVTFIETVKLDDAGRLVRMAVQRAVVQQAIGLELSEIVEISEVTLDEIRERAQRLLDAMRCGIELTDVSVPDARPPLAISRAYQEFQNSREQARRSVEESHRTSQEMLIAIAGENYGALADLIDTFEEAHERGEGETALAAVNEFLDGGRNGGQLRERIEQAKAYESQIDLTLGAEVKRFLSVLPAYQDRPDAVVKQHWVEACRNVLSREDAEIFVVLAGGGALRLAVSGSEQVRQLRQENRIRARQQQAAQEFGRFDFTKRAADTEPGRPRPLMRPTEGGGVAPRGGSP